MPGVALQTIFSENTGKNFLSKLVITNILPWNL
jgi:hypothetical protein